MNTISIAVAEVQKQSLEAALDLTQSYLAAIERLAQLNTAVTRNSIEKSSEIALLCLNASWSREAISGWARLISLPGWSKFQFESNI